MGCGMMIVARYWMAIIAFVAVQVMCVYLMIYRENSYVAYLYTLQKLEQAQAQLHQEYSALYNELQKNKNLSSLKEYAEQTLGLEKLPVSVFRNLYDSNPL
jgi:hypothetical protein